MVWVCWGEKFFRSIGLRLRSIVEDGLDHSFDFIDDLCFELTPEYHVLRSDDLPVAIPLQLDTSQMLGTFSHSILAPVAIEEILDNGHNH